MLVSDFALGLCDHLPDGAGNGSVLRSNGENRRGLGQSVAFEKQNAGGAEELIHCRGEGAAAADSGNEAPAEPRLDLPEDQGRAERGKGLEEQPGQEAGCGVECPRAGLEVGNAAAYQIVRMLVGSAHCREETEHRPLDAALGAYLLDDA